MDNLLMERVVDVIVTCPVFEQVAENIQSFCLGGGMPHEMHEHLCAALLVCAEV